MRRSSGDERHGDGGVTTDPEGLRPEHARRAWELFEPYHAVVYFTPDARSLYQEAGLKGGWMGYFASRSAAMGAVSAEVVVATFYNFHPQMVKRSIPDAWKFSSPERVLEARLQVADSGLRTGLGDLVTSEMVSETARLAWRAVEAATVTGRPLFGAHLSLDRPYEPHLSLWLALTCLREHRGDGHIACLVSNGVDGLDANVLMEAAGVIPGEMQRSFRGWSEEEWTAAADRLRARGLLGASGLTEEGAALRDRVEGRTDELALQPWKDSGEPEYRAFVDNMKVLVANILESDALPYPNPMGLTRPTP